MPSTLAFSRTLAVIYGIVLPLRKTVRRWGAIDWWPAFLDNWCTAAFLLLGV